MDVVVFGDRVFNFQINKVKKMSVKLKCNAEDSSPEYIFIRAPRVRKICLNLD